MLYHLFSYLETHYNLPGTQLMEFLSFRAGMAVLTSLLIGLVFGKRIVRFLQRKQIGESIRDLGLKGQNEKAGTPTMGGVIILGAILIPTLLFANLTNVYVQLMLVSTVWLGLIGFVDDYIKVFKKNKKGLAGKFKILGQIVLGLLVGATLYFHEEVKIRDFDNVYVYRVEQGKPVGKHIESYPANGKDLGSGELTADGKFFLSHDVRSNVTTIPFFKNNELNYSNLLNVFGGDNSWWGWLVFIPIVIFIITAVSNGANLTDGLDGLATGSSAIMVFVLLVFAYVSGNVILADYLNIMYIPMSGELVVFGAAFVGACIGFLWFNAYPAQVFMGDTGSLAIGGIIASLAIVIRKELLIPVICGIFLMESLSVILQVSYFKYTKKRFGEGKRIFLMSPLHHHYQKLGMPENKIVVRFWIVGILLAIISIVTLKIR